MNSTAGRVALAIASLVAASFSVTALMESRRPQSPIRPIQVDSRESLTVNDGRPVAEAAWQLEKRYGWVITYEDPIYIHSSEIVDVTTQVRRDLDQYKPGEAPKVFVPKGGELSINLNLNSETGRPVNSPESVMQQILDANTEAGYAGRFRLESDGQILHIIPTAYRDRFGALVPQQSVLDSIITIPSQERSGLQSLELLCHEVGRITRTKISLGTIDPNLFANSRNHLSAHREKARDFLVKLLQSTTVDTSLSWRLLYDPTMKIYFLNIHAVTK